MKVFTDSEYVNLMPRPTDMERMALKKSIEDNGQLMPIIINPEGKIIDGHTRFSICEELGIHTRVTVKHFASHEKERQYAKITNIKRRHLTPFQIAELIDDIRNEWKKEKRIETNALIGQIKRGTAEPIPKEELVKTQTHMKAAELCGIKSATMQKIDYIRRHGTVAEITAVRNESISIDSMYRRLVNKRHKLEVSGIRNKRIFPQCESCGEETRFSGKCHVHYSYCCTKCVWGK